MVKYEPIQGEVFTTQPKPEESRMEQFQQEEPAESARPSACCIPFFFLGQVFKCLGNACIAICSCDEVDAEY